MNHKFHSQKQNRAKDLSRRDFIKISAVTAIGAAGITQLAGCSAVHTDTGCLASILSGAGSENNRTFEASSIGSIRLKNRIIRSSVTMNGCDAQGRPTPDLLSHYRDIAAGGAGAVITGMRDTGMMIDHFLYQDQYFNDYKKVPDTIHGYNVPVIQQLSHHGGYTSLTGKNNFSVNKMSDSAIEDIIDGFVMAVEITKKLGFDGVQLHGAHGYALSQFLSPAVNKRSDKWGGSTENRFRIIREIYKRSSLKTGNFPVMIKINAYDNQRGGMRIEEAVRTAKLLEETGFAAIEVSCGTIGDGFSTIRVPEIPNEALLEFSEYGDIPSFIKPLFPFITSIVVNRFEPLYNYNVCAANEISENVKIPVIVVGGIRKIEEINPILNSGAADYVSMGRPFIIEPDIVNRFRAEENYKSGCIECGYCIAAASDPGVKVRCFYGTL